jgi:hypothetical protein
MPNIAEGRYQICSFNGLALDAISERVVTHGHQLHALQPNNSVYQMWLIQKAPDRSGGYTIRWDGPIPSVLEPVESAAGTGTGTPICLMPPSDSLSQQWRITAVDVDAYELINQGTNMALALDQNGPAVVQESPTRATHQRWTIQALESE